MRELPSARRALGTSAPSENLQRPRWLCRPPQESSFMATSVQIVFDCADPDALGTFWAEALHYKPQEPPAGFGSWEAFLKAQRVPEAEWNTANAIVDPEKTGPRIYFQKMD